MTGNAIKVLRLLSFVLDWMSDLDFLWLFQILLKQLGHLGEGIL